MIRARGGSGSRKRPAGILVLVLGLLCALVPPAASAALADTTPPGVVKAVTTSGLTHNHVTLSWANPATADYAGVMIRRRPGTTPPTKTGGSLVGYVDAATTSYDDYGLEPSKTYTYGLFSYDEVPNYSVAVAKTVTTPRYDVEAPGPVTDLRATTVTTTSIKLAWTNPDDTDFDGVEVRRLKGAVAPADRTKGTLVRETGPAATSFTDSGLMAGATYSYAFFPHDDVGNYGPSTTLSAVTDTGDPVTTADWLQARQGPEHRSWSPRENLIRPSNLGSVEEEWTSLETGAPVIDGTTLYVSGVGEDGGSQLAAYNLADGETRWRTGTGSCHGPAALTSALVVISCSGLQAYRRTGAHDKVWDIADTDPGQQVTNHLVVGETVVAWSQDRVNAYRVSDGQRIWQVVLPEGASRVWDVAASGDRVLVGYDDRLRSLSLANGNQLWSQPGGSFDVIVSGDWVYTRATNVRRYALDDGEAGWSVTPDHGVDGLFAADNGTIYAWSVEFDDLGGITYSALRALRTADGSQKWQYDVPARVSNVGIAGSLVWLTSTSIFSQGHYSSLIALNRLDGAQLKRIDFEDNIYAPGGFGAGVAFGAGKVVLDQGGSFGNPEPRRLRVFGLGGARPTVETDVLRMGRVGTPYSQQLDAAANAVGVQWSVAAGALPAGITLSGSGQLSGTPTTAGQRQVTIRATSSNGRTHEVSFPLQVVKATTSANWSMGGMTGARNPFSPGTGDLDLPNAPTLAYRWATAAGTAVHSYPADVVIKGNFFYTVAGNGELKAYDIRGLTANRAPKWHVVPGPGNVFEGAIVVAGSTLLVRDRDEARLWAIDAATGDDLWSTDPGVVSDRYGSPLVVDDTVVVHGPSGLLAFSVDDGSPQWEETLTDRVFPADLATDGTRIYGAVDCVLYALDATTGAEEWASDPFAPAGQCSGEHWPNPPPIVTGGRVYATAVGHKLVVKATTGATVDTFRSYTSGHRSGVVAGGLWIYPEDGGIVAYDTTSGRRAWKVPTPSGVGFGTMSLAATGDLVIVATHSGIVGLDRVTGALVWDGGSFDGMYGLRRGSFAIGKNRILVPTTTGVRAYGPL